MPTFPLVQANAIIVLNCEKQISTTATPFCISLIILTYRLAYLKKSEDFATISFAQSNSGALLNTCGNDLIFKDEK